MLVLLLGLEADDAINTQPELGGQAHVCALTLYDATECDSAPFLQEMMLLAEAAGTWRSVRARALVDTHMASWPARLQPLRIEACGHVFAALPLLYLVMEGGFWCPMCRGGSPAAVSLQRAALPCLPTGLWELLCLLCAEARARTARAELANNEAAARDMQAAAQPARVLLLSEILDLVSIRVIFSILRSAVQGSAAANSPSSVIVFDLELRAPPSPLTSVVFESRTSRHVSQPLRLGGVFAVRIIVNAYEQTHVLYDSHRVKYPARPRGAGADTAFDVSVPGDSDAGIGGSLRMRYEACPYDHLYFMKRVEYTSIATAVQNMFPDF